MKQGTRVLVCGGRGFDDTDLLESMLAAFHNGPQGPIVVLVHGAARGADSLAGKSAEREGIPVEAYPANWEAEGRAAGPIRNKRMLDQGKPDLLIAFPGGRGTAKMVKQARGRGTEVVEVKSSPVI